MEADVIEPDLPLGMNAEVIARHLEALIEAGAEEWMAELAFEFFAQAFFPPFGDEPLESCPGADLAGTVIAIDSKDGKEDRDYLFGGDENIQGGGEAGAGTAQRTADEDVEPGDSASTDVTSGGNIAQVLRLGIPAVVAASGDGYVKLAWEVGELLTCLKMSRNERVDERGRVKQLHSIDTGEWTADEVADVVHACLARADTGGGEAIDDLRDVR